MTFFISDNYRSGICMAIIEIGRREKRIRRSAGPIPLTVTTDSLVRVSAKLENESSHHVVFRSIFSLLLSLSFFLSFSFRVSVSRYTASVRMRILHEIPR